MRSVCYSVAMSLDGFIAGPHGEYNWIPDDPDIDFAALFARYDTVVMGRASWDVAQSDNMSLPGQRIVVCSRSLDPAAVPGAEVTADAVETVRALKQDASPDAKDIWLFGGGELFRVLLDAGLVDEVETAVVPVLLNQGIPFLPSGPAAAVGLAYVESVLYPKSGILLLRYRVRQP